MHNEKKELKKRFEKGRESVTAYVTCPCFGECNNERDRSSLEGQSYRAEYRAYWG